MSERAAYLALASLPRQREVIEVLQATGSALATWTQLGPAGRDPRAELRLIEAGPDRLITPADAEYPPSLSHLALPPLALYLRGQTLPRGASVAIVGSRCATAYGMSVAERLGRDLARVGVSVVSGLARGVDTAAHTGALRNPEGRPVAVLGCGLDHDYPVENRALRQRLERAGTVVSEYTRGEPPQAWRFPARNRILAALSGAVLVVEAHRRSGALITARHALDLGREVLVVPGDVGHPNSQGVLELLRDGATPVGSAEHVLQALGMDPAAYLPDPLDPVQERVLACLAPRGSLADELVERTRLTVPQLLVALGQLQVLGRVRRVGPAFVRV